MIRMKATNVDVFIDVVGTDNCDSAINMDLLDDEGVNHTFLESRWVVDNFENLITRFVVTETAAKGFCGGYFHRSVFDDDCEEHCNQR